LIRVLVGATSATVRAGLESLVREGPGTTLAGGSSSLTAVARQIETLQPDVVLIELDHDAEEDATAVSALGGHSRAGGPAIVVLADDLQGAWTAEALRAGVRAVLPREATPAEIVSALEAAAAGLVALHPDAIGYLLRAQPLQAASEGAMPARPGQALTPREIEVLGMLAEGLGNKEIAWRLHISEHTVKFHVASILSKLDASSRTEAVTAGFRQGLIML
jgi:two-component system, NarL family, response regulator YdfI